MRGRLILNYCLNFSSSVLLIYASKYIFRQYSISCLTFAIVNCFLSSSFSSIALQYFSTSPKETLPSKTRWKTLCRLFLISGSFSAFIIFGNLSLQHNTIGTYQLIKLNVAPILMLIEWIQLRYGLNSQSLTKEKFSRNYSPLVIFCFALITLGTFLRTYYDLRYDLYCTLYGAISVVCNALYQAMVQRDEASSTYERIYFLQYQTLISWILLFPCWCIIDSSFVFNWYALLEWHAFGILILCGMIAFVLNGSVIWCIKDDTAISYNIVGQLKTILIVLFGSVLFDESLILDDIITMSLTTLGSVIYIYLTYRTDNVKTINKNDISR